jgi:hypothetical protein
MMVLTLQLFAIHPAQQAKHEFCIAAQLVVRYEYFERIRVELLDSDLALYREGHRFASYRLH